MDSQLTFHLAPVVLSVPAQRKARSILLMLRRVLGGTMRGGDEVDRLGGKHRLDEGRASNGGDILAIPWDQLCRHLIFKELEVHRS